MRKERLTNEELVARFQAGDREAFDRLYVQTIGLVKKYSGLRMNGRNRDEIISEGNLVLWNCAMKFRPEHGKFSTYLVRSVFYGVAKVYEKSLAKRDAMFHRDAVGWFDAEDHRSTEAPDLDRSLFLAAAERALSSISERRRNVIIWHCQGLTYQEIGVRLGVTRSRAGQIIKETITELRMLCEAC